MKQCKHNSAIDCDDNCYSCNGCGWSKQEQENRRKLIEKGCMQKKNGLSTLNLRRVKKRTIDDNEVKRLCEQGKSISEIAEILGFEPFSISRAKKRIGMQGSMTRNRQYKVTNSDGVVMVSGTAKQCAVAIGVSTSTIHKAYHMGTRKDGMKVETL